jgi:hypothetical protein
VSFADALRSASAGYQSTGAATGPALASVGSPNLPSTTSPTLARAYPYTTATAGASAALALAYPDSGIAGVSGLGAPTSTPSTAALDGITAAPGESTGARIVAIAESQIGQTEQPPGSNESPAIAQYRGATAGAIPGAPWCAYFASWAARQAGAPLGAQGEGLGAVSEIWSWAQSTGRAIPNGPGVVPQPGDLIVFGDEHVGIVKDVLPDGDIQTVEGNYENKVAQNVRTPTEATGYVDMN